MKGKLLMIGVIVLALALIALAAVFLLGEPEKKGTKIEIGKYNFSDSDLRSLGSAGARGMPPSPTTDCLIEGFLTDIEFVDAYNDSCMNSSGGCPTDYNPEKPAQYVMRVYVLDVKSTTEPSENAARCENFIPVNDYQIFFITADKVREPPVEGARISISLKSPAQVHRVDSYSILLVM